MRRILTNGAVLVQDTNTGETEHRILIVGDDDRILAVTEERATQLAATQAEEQSKPTPSQS